MKKPLAIALLIIFGNALTFAGSILVAYSVLVFPLFGVLGAAAYAALSVISSRHFKRKFSFNYRKYFLSGAFPALVISAVLGLFVLDADSTMGVISMFAMYFAIAYCLLFGGALLVVWGRETYG